MSSKNIFTRFIGHKGVQTFLIYISGGWIVLEITEYLIGIYQLSESIRSIVSIILLAGLPITLFTAWYINRKAARLDEIKEPELTDGQEASPEISSRVSVYNLSPRQFILIAALVIFAAGITFLFRWRHERQIKWAREVLLPEIEILANGVTGEGQGSYSVFEKLSEAASIIPDDPVLLRLEKSMSFPIQVLSEPPGARVYFQPYETDELTWSYLGLTPIEHVSIPRGLNKIKLLKQGYDPLIDLVCNPDEVQSNIRERIPFLKTKDLFSNFHLHARPSKNTKLAQGGLRKVDTGGIGNWQNHKARLLGQIIQHGSITPDLIRYGYEKDDHWIKELNGVEANLNESHPMPFYEEKFIRNKQYFRSVKALKVWFYHTDLYLGIRKAFHPD
jgi:hypothetical protein